MGQGTMIMSVVAYWLGTLNSTQYSIEIDIPMLDLEIR